MANGTLDRVQDTARWAAASRAVESARDDALFHDRFARRFVGQDMAAMLEICRRIGGTWPVVARTVLIDRLLVEAANDGADAVLNLAAGYDTRPYRLVFPRSLLWIDVDHADVIAARARELDGENASCAIEQRALDLSDDAARRALFADVGARFQRLIGASGAIVGECSAATEHWFGKAKPGQQCAHYLFADDSKQELEFAVALSQLLEDILPWQLSVEQMPQRIERQGLILELTYRQIGDDKNGLAVLLVARDVTARVRSEEAERDLREEQGLVSQLLADKQGFALFVSEVEALLQALENEPDVTRVRRDLHTLKGNVAIFGLHSLARCCHSLEDKLEEPGSLPSSAELANLSRLFRSKLKEIEPILTGVARDAHEVASDDLSALVSSLQNREDYQEILKMVELWSWQRTSERLARLRAETEYVAQRLGKAVRIEVAHGNLRTPPGYLDKVWPTLVHAVRNAVDHGIESASERTEAGKPAEGLIRLSTRQTDQAFFIEIADDGRGVDLQALQRNAEERGLSSLESTNMLDLVFADGLSSRATVTELSGRGVGLAATRAACEAELGSVDVETQVGSGTRLVFEFRRPILRTDRRDGSARRWSLLPPAASVHCTAASASASS